jgi:Protein of unknown function (DUF499)
MSKLAWTPWHQVVQLREDIKSGELSMATFAADLYDVVMGRAKPVYQIPSEFFALTYPTFNLRELAKDVCTRLAGKNEKAVRQLELTYGGGKTHTLITLNHLVAEPASLPDLPAVKEFVQHIGMTPPKARVAVLAFDKLDPEKGMEVKGPAGEKRWLRNPWSVLAYQIGGDAGLQLLHADGKAEERESAPAENLMVELLALPSKNNLSTLLLIDEVLMFARGKIGIDPSWRGKLVDFFQYLTQAATKVDRCAIVASLLATDPSKSDSLGKELTNELYAIFRRQKEEGVQPVQKEDVAEVLRRRFFTPDSIRDREAFRSHVVAALKGISTLDEQTSKEGKTAEDRFLKSYPFHPDLTEIFYTKWTNLESFQRTRGILRTFALALRDAEKWDQSPLVSTNAFLSLADTDSISESARELTGVATSEEYEGKKQEWSAILQGELNKAKQIQQTYPGLRHREAEQAVFATFLHSQPIGQKAVLREIYSLVGHTRPDKIELEKALRRWTEVSWFLDEGAIADAELGGDGKKALPKTWRLGSRPNLRQMHSAACDNVIPDLVEAKLLDEIQKVKSLTAGAAAVVGKVHNLPEKPKDIEDDGEFHYGVLGPKAASDSGKPSAEARRFIDEKTSADSQRVYRNAIVLAAPSRDGLDVVRNAIKEYLGWEEVTTQLKDQELDPTRTELLSMNRDAARKRIPEAVQQAYCIVVTVSDKNDVQAFKLAIDNKPLFQIIKEDARSRIQDTAISAEAMLPGGPYDLWREGETAHRVKDLVNAFAQRPQLPKMLNRKAILDTIVDGCVNGAFVLKLTRPDKSVRTFWRQTPDEVAIKDAGLEVVLPEAAELTEVSPGLLSPQILPALWGEQSIAAKDIFDYFAGGKVVKVQREGYEEPVAIPKAEKSVVESAIETAVKEGRLWLTSGPASVFSEEIPTGLLNNDAQLQPPPDALSPMAIVPDVLTDAWSNGTATALSISVALSKKAGKPLPWAPVRDAIDGAIRTRILERTEDSGPWPSEYSNSKNVRLRRPLDAMSPPPPPPPPTKPGVLVARAELRSNQIQDLADQISDITLAAAGLDLKFNIQVEVSGTTPASADAIAKLNKLFEGIAEDFKLR